MYNGIGIPTPRGSGTSGYVQKNKASLYNKSNKTGDYKEILQKFQSNPLPFQKEVNEKILEHELLYKIEAEMYRIRKTNEKKFPNKEKLEEYLTIERKKLEEFYKERYHSGLKDVDGYQENNYLKEKRLKDLKNIFHIEDSYKQGEAFDKEKQEEKRRINKEKKEIMIKEQKKDEKRKKKLEELELLEKLIEEDKKLDEKIEERLKMIDK